ncbi:MAG TPA: hypothetical protein PK760_10170 [Flavobacteriales bacterium]|nr:hypothetical protein [Flavobacteriales bacterium]
MRALFTTSLFVLSCASAPTPVDADGDGTISPAEVQAASEQQPTKKFVEGKDYVVLERLRVIDPTGFAQPMEAYSILVPKGWKSQGGITWKVGNPCMVEAINNRVTATSPDGSFALEIYPTQQWEWCDDQFMLQSMMQQQQNPVFRRCPLAEPMDAGQFLQGPMAQEMGAEIVTVEPNEEMNAVLQQQAQAANQQYRQAGVDVENRPSAALATLRFPNGDGGIALCSIGMTVAHMPNMLNGGRYANYTCATNQKVALRCPAGQEAEARKLLSTMLASFRLNPQWQAGVQQMFNNVAVVEQRETAKRAAIQREAMNYSADLQQRTWEEGQASNDRIAEGWSQTLRGVETWKDPSGGAVELSGGYNEAWSRPDGSYILSNDPLFDPNVAFQESWKRLEKR